jgi:signal peptidase
MKRTYKILEKALYAFFIVVILLLVWSLLPIKGAPRLLAVLSGSMEPTIHTGSVVVIVPESQYTVGDIVTFGPDTRTQVPTTHRIVSDRAEEGVILFTTKGDANNSPDTAEIKQSDILGKVLFSIPFAGYVIDFVRQPIGFVIVVILPVLFIIGDEIRKIVREVRRMKKEKQPQPTEKNA